MIANAVHSETIENPKVPRLDFRLHAWKRMSFAARIRALVSVLLVAAVVFAVTSSECAACHLAAPCCHQDAPCQKMQSNPQTPAQQAMQPATVLPDLRVELAVLPSISDFKPLADPEPANSLTNLALRI